MIATALAIAKLVTALATAKRANAKLAKSKLVKPKLPTITKLTKSLLEVLAPVSFYTGSYTVERERERETNHISVLGLARCPRVFATGMRGFGRLAGRPRQVYVLPGRQIACNFFK